MRNAVLLSASLFLLSACASMTEDTDKEVPSNGVTGTSLVGAPWHIVELAGEPVANGTAPHIEFSEDGQVSGNASCNRLIGSWQQDGEQLSFAPLATTRMFCEDPAGSQENRLLALLDRVVRLQWDDADTLILLTDEAEQIKARRQ